jgi:hypothetical protein
VNRYKVSISDRKLARTVEASSAQEAVEIAVGQRLYSARPDGRNVYRDGRIESWIFDLTIAVHRPTAQDRKRGTNATEVVSRRAVVYPA